MKDWRLYKGIPAGKLISFMLEKLGYSQSEFSQRIHIQPQLLNSIIKGHRPIPLALCLTLDNELGFTEGSFAFLQLQNQINHIKEKNIQIYDGVPAIRRIVFWDTDFDKIDWSRHKDYVVRRVMDYGNEEEKQEIRRFYGIQ